MPITSDIDAAVLCEKVLGWKLQDTTNCEPLGWVTDETTGYMRRTPDFENVFADAWLLVKALGPRQQFTLERWPSENLTTTPTWKASMMGSVIPAGKSWPPRFEVYANTEAQAITRVRWLMFQEEGK